MNLETAVEAIESLSWPDEDDDGAAYGFLDDPRTALAARLAALERAVSGFAWVETPGVAATWVNWGADFRTVWRGREAAAHWRTLERETGRRIRLLRALTAALQFAARIQLAVVAPTTWVGAIMAARELIAAVDAVLQASSPPPD